ncbi:E3 ubiquitin-protein ligase [Mizuhopecten yessoensis]|uniref:E3 ubiquitin-protein ligase n=2 Tax=Mizuhopecten yessoensis TaxID=6573 RepID=A0A210Q1K4_MIZYE|nr:E3 ubiquitin-protein ligase [Mizuhopecten yessoensis]
MTKIESVFKDAKLIASIVSDTDVEKIYESLKSKRRNPNRVDVVMNNILENAGIYQKTTVSEREDTSALLLADFVSVIDKAMANMEALPLTAEEIQHLLQEEGNRPDRVDRVFTKILRQVYNPKHLSEEDVRLVMNQMPEAHPDQVRKLVSDIQGQSQADRVKQVISALKNNTVASLKKDDSIPQDPTVSNDPLFKDMQIVKKVVPHKDPNEIYAYLEAHYDKKNRIKLVIEELMSDERDSEDADHDMKEAGGTGIKKPSIPGVGEFEEELQELKDIFPDCDPNYLYNALEERKDDVDRVKKLAIRMLEKKDYPKLKEVLDNESKLKKKQKIIKATFDMKEFLAKFPDPELFFCDKNKAMSNNYKKHVTVQLQNDFRKLSEEYLQQIMEASNYCLTLCKRVVLTNISDLGDFMSELFVPTQRPLLPLPEEPEELFFNEMLYLRNEREIKNHLQQQRTLKEMRREEARANGELLPCECCFDDECLFEDMTSCQDGHLFCKECVRRSSEVVIGDGKCSFPCLTDSCDYQFPLPVLQEVMSPNMFSILLKRIQEAEVKQADIPDLVSCPFCSFATIISNPDDKVFKCLNPECLKESCRLCGEPSHIPLRCNEVEKQGETDMRTYIETRVTEAMLRKCHNCNKRFIKEAGCNKMTCTCGATQCYFCREENIDYDHFNKGTCSNQEESTVIHVQEMEAAAHEARRQYLEDHPEAKDMVLKYDPVTHIQDVKKHKNYMWGDGDNFNEFNGSEDGYREDESENSDYE